MPLPGINPIPDCQLTWVFGLLETLEDRGGRDDGYKIARELHFKFSDLLKVMKTAEILGFVSTPAGDVELRIEMTPPPPAGFNTAAMGGDRVRLLAAGTLVAELDGRYWTAETCASFTGRVIGLYASAGTVSFAGFRYRGTGA